MECALRVAVSHAVELNPCAEPRQGITVSRWLLTPWHPLTQMIHYHELEEYLNQPLREKVFYAVARLAHLGGARMDQIVGFLNWMEDDVYTEAEIYNSLILLASDQRVELHEDRFSPLAQPSPS